MPSALFHHLSSFCLRFSTVFTNISRYRENVTRSYDYISISKRCSLSLSLLDAARTKEGWLPVTVSLRYYVFEGAVKQKLWVPVYSTLYDQSPTYFLLELRDHLTLLLPCFSPSFCLFLGLFLSLPYSLHLEAFAHTSRARRTWPCRISCAYKTLSLVTRKYHKWSGTDAQAQNSSGCKSIYSWRHRFKHYSQLNSSIKNVVWMNLRGYGWML